PTALRAGIHAAPIAKRAAPNKTWIEGLVLDAASDRPIAGARIELTRGARDAPLTLIADSAGRFRSPELALGSWSIAIEAAGSRRLLGTTVLPHRGEWLERRIALASLRAEAVSSYKPAALKPMPTPEAWTLWTLRETIDRARSTGTATESFVQ